jgi:hypothetical protein
MDEYKLSLSQPNKLVFAAVAAVCAVACAGSAVLAQQRNSKP